MQTLIPVNRRTTASPEYAPGPVHQPADEPLSEELRRFTAPLHARVEATLGLPGSITDGRSYRAWIARFYGLYEPLEQTLQSDRDWSQWGLAVQERAQSGRLASDLAVLQVDRGTIVRAASSDLPDLPSFAHALGALYVLEGSTLGGQIILRHLQARASDVTGGAIAFFTGHGAQTRPMWQSFTCAVDAFGEQGVGARAAVREGAADTFLAFLHWFGSWQRRAA